MKFFFLLGFLVACTRINASRWYESVTKPRYMQYACLKQDVLFKFDKQLESGNITKISWKYYDRVTERGIATTFFNEFVVAKAYVGRVTITDGGGFILRKVSLKDTGTYLLKTEKEEGGVTRVNYHRYKLLVTEGPMFEGNSLVVSLSDQAEWNSDNTSLSLFLTCGDFIYSNESNVYISAEWVTPYGSVKNSTKYNNGKFYLQLDNPVQHGQYTCRIPKDTKSLICANNRHNTDVPVSIDEDQTRIILMNSQIKMLNKGISEAKTQDGILEHKIEMMNEKIHQVERQNKTSCEDWFGSRSGKRKIYLPNKQQPVEIYCDQATDGGRWNVFQRRIDGSVDFFRGWSDYREGFGDPEREFWLGLESMHQMTSDGRTYELRFELMREDGARYYAVYDGFSIQSESAGYAIYFTGYRGTGGNSLTIHNGMRFSTKNRDQDKTGMNCAETYLGASWYNSCHLTNLNGHYNDKNLGKGLTWFTLTGLTRSLKATEIKFRIKH